MLQELRGILMTHARRYPAMEPCDGVKLVFQNEFGPGHMIDDAGQSLRTLQAEYAATARDPAAPLAEDVGNGLVRVMLAAVDPARYPLQELNRDFVRSAQLRAGSAGRFLQKLETLRALAREGVFGFSAGELERYLDAYLSSGCPPVSHSPGYRSAYRPAYRVVLRSASLPLFIQELEALCTRKKRVLAAVDGRCAAGKTTLAKRLQDAFGWGVIHMDDFFLRPEQRTEKRLGEPGGNIDYERFSEQVLLPLRRGESPAYQPYDCKTGRLLAPRAVPASPVILAEGSYACHPAFGDAYDLRAFLTISPEKQMERILARNGAEYAQVFRRKWIPLEERYFSAFQIKDSCDYCLEA